MEELQLALTATRVDQKNFGLWLRNWQVGQVLQALVTDKSPSGQLVLRVAGQQITATADIPVQKGATLQLEVSSLTPTPTLKVINAPGLATAAPAAAVPSPATISLGQQLQALLPHQGDISAPLSTLLNPAGNANIMALLGSKTDILEALYKSISRAADLSVPSGLKQAMQNSGLFLESTLAAMLQGAPSGPVGDLKTALLRLHAQLNQALVQLQANTGASAEDIATLRALQEQVQGALTTIILNQLTSQSIDTNGNRTWITHIPFTLDDSVQTLSVQIFQDRGGKGSSGKDGDKSDWKVQFDLSLPKLGRIESELYLYRDKLSVTLYAERSSTANYLQSGLPQLESALESRGLQLSVAVSQQGKLAQSPVTARFQSCVDTSA